MAWQVEHLAALLDIELAPGSAAQLAGMAGLDGMRANAARLAPNVGDGYWKDPAMFFRSGRSGDWRDIIGRDEIAEYAWVMPSLGSPDLIGCTAAGSSRHGSSASEHLIPARLHPACAGSSRSSSATPRPAARSG